MGTLRILAILNALILFCAVLVRIKLPMLVFFEPEISSYSNMLRQNVNIEILDICDCMDNILQYFAKSANATMMDVVVHKDSKTNVYENIFLGSFGLIFFLWAICGKRRYFELFLVVLLVHTALILAPLPFKEFYLTFAPRHDSWKCCDQYVYLLNNDAMNKHMVVYWSIVMGLSILGIFFSVTATKMAMTQRNNYNRKVDV